MNKTSATLTFFALLCLVLACLLFFEKNVKEDKQILKQNYTLAASKKIESAVKILSDGNLIYTISYDLKIRGYNLKLEKLFEEKLSVNSYPQAFSLNKNTIYVGTDDGDILAFSLDEKKQIWSKKISDKTAGDFSFSKDYIFIGSYNKKVYALNYDGSESFVIEASDAVNGRILLAKNAAYFANCAGDLEAFDVKRKEKIWQTRLDSHLPLAPILYENTLLVAGHKGTIYSVNSKDGKKISESDNLGVLPEIQMENFEGKFFFADKDANFSLGNFSNLKCEKSVFIGEKRMEYFVCGSKIALAVKDGRVKIFDVKTFSEIYNFDLQVRIDGACFTENMLLVLDASSVLHIFIKNENNSRN